MNFLTQIDYSATELILAIVILYVAYLVRGITGFGSGLIAIPLLALMFPLKVVVPIIVLLDLIGSGAQAISNRDKTNWSVLLPLLPATLIGILWASYYFQSVDTATLSWWLGVFVITFGIYQVLPTPALRGGAMMAMPFGVLGGLIGTLFGTGGPFYVVYLTMRDLEKSSFRASYAMYFLVDGIARVSVYIFGLGLLNAQWLMLLVGAFVPFSLGLYTGGKVHRDIPAIYFKYLISLILVASGATLILKNQSPF